LRIAAGLAALLALGACSGQPPAAPQSNAAEPVLNASPQPPTQAARDTAPATPAADAPVAQWLVGHWAYEDDCATDFTVVYSADGKLDAHGEVGSWKAEGNQVTETVTAHMGEAGTEPIDPPQVIRYTVEKQGADRGVLRRGNASQPIRRC
jgi:hypothetical protein